MRTPDEPTPTPTDAVPNPHVASHHVTALELVWRNVWVRAATYLLLAGGLVTIAWTLRGRYAFVLQVGVIGFVIAYILNPVVEALKRIRIRRVFGVIIVYVALLNLLVLGSLLLGQVVVELSRFVSLIPEAVGTFGTQLGRIGVWFEGIVDRLPAPITLFLDQRLGLTAPEGDLALQAQDRVAGVLEAVVANLLALFENLLSGGPAILVSGATTIVNATLQTFLIVLVSVYFLYDFPRFVESFKRVVPVRWRGVSDDLLEKADRAVGGYLRGQLLITSLLGILIWIGLSIAGVPFATAISFLAAIFNLVPYLGPIVGAVPAILLGFTVGAVDAVVRDPRVRGRQSTRSERAESPHPLAERGFAPRNGASRDSCWPGSVGIRGGSACRACRGDDEGRARGLPVHATGVHRADSIAAGSVRG